MRKDDGLEAEQVGDDRVLRSLIKVASHKEKNDGLFDYQGERDKTTWAK